jgi:hypothetical protein
MTTTGRQAMSIDSHVHQAMSTTVCGRQAARERGRFDLFARAAPWVTLF